MARILQVETMWRGSRTLSGAADRAPLTATPLYAQSGPKVQEG